MNRSETKFHNTALKMHEALFRLLEKKEFSDISIMELCAEAGVNRSTFYSHYDNTCDLIKDAYRERLQEFFKSYSKSLEDIADLDAAESIFISPDYLMPYLAFVKENKQFFKVYMNNLQSFDADDVYTFLIEKVFLPIYQKNGISDRTIANYMSKFYLQGITSIVVEWVNRDCADDEYFICEIITMCVRPYTRPPQ